MLNARTPYHGAGAMILTIACIAMLLSACTGGTPTKAETALGADLPKQEATSQAAALLNGYWVHYVRTEPLDACTLGVAEACERLPDLSPQTWEARAGFARDTLARIRSLPVDALPPQLAKDIESIRRLALYTVYQADRKFELWNIAWSDIPPTMLLLQAVQARVPADWEALAARLEAYRSMLDQHEANLLAGRAVSLSPDYEETRMVADRSIPEEAIPILRTEMAKIIHFAGLPGALTSRLLRASEQAAAALEDHDVFLKEFYRGLPKPWRPDGAAEVAWRLRELFGEKGDPKAVFEKATEWVRQDQALVVELMQRVDPEVRDFPQAAAAYHRLLSDTPRTKEKVLEMYRQVEARLERESRKAGIPLPPGFVVRIMEAPLGYCHIAAVSNFPPSLLRPGDPPLFVVSVEAPCLAGHDRVSAPDLSAHEGCPGHALKAAWWAYLYSGSKAPIGWAHQHDLVNGLSGAWMTNPHIEGWGLLAEGLLETAYTPEEAVAVQMGRLLRAIRVRIDVGLHAGFLSREQAAAELSNGLGIPLERARDQVLSRYARKSFVGQASTYYLGMRQIEHLRADWLSEHPGAAANDFYREFFKQPPLPPNILRRWMLGKEGK